MVIIKIKSFIGLAITLNFLGIALAQSNYLENGSKNPSRVLTNIPKPNGPNSVETTILHLTDKLRKEKVISEPDDQR